MKIQWQKDDVFGGVRVCRSVDGDSYMIGFEPVPANSRDSQHYILISLVDGMVTFRNSSRAEFAVTLNNEGVMPLEVPPMFTGTVS